MPPTSSLTALLNSPANSNESTIIANGKTLPDISLGSLGSSFRSEDQDGSEDENPGHGCRKPVARAPRLSAVHSPETSNSASIETPSPPHPASALVSLSPPMTVRKSSSSSRLPDQQPGSQAPRRSRILRKASTSSMSSSDAGRPTEARYGATSDEDSEAGGVLSSLSLNVTPGRKLGASGYGRPHRRGGRHSVAVDAGGSGALTLRDQEQQLNGAKKEIFNLQLENHFLKERLSNMAPDHIEAAVKENVKLKLEILNLSKEMKKLKKLLLQQDRDLAEAQREREGGKGSKGRDAETREMERLYREEKERRKAAEAELKLGRERGSEEDVETLRAQLDDVVASEDQWRQRAEQLEEDLGALKVNADDQAEEVERYRDAADRAQEEVERIQAETNGLGESVGVSRGREARLAQKLEQQNTELLAEVDLLRKGGGVDIEELEERLNTLRDQLATAQLDVDRRDEEIQQLNEELDVKIGDHEKEIGQVEAEWRDEVLEARAQVEELKDVLESREQDLKDIRESLTDREDELRAATARTLELEAAQNQTHDQLEDTLKNIEEDNAEKEADLVAANREVETMGQRIYELEETVEDLRLREQELGADLRGAEEAFESQKMHYENLVEALKEARKKLQSERDDALAAVKDIEAARVSDHDGQRRLITDKDHALDRLRADLQAAKDKVTRKDEDLVSMQNALRGVQDERRKIGDERTSDRFSLELEIDRLKRDLAACEDELTRAKDDLDALTMDKTKLLDKHHDLEARLSSERQGRLNISDKLDLANKTARQHERDAASLRGRIEELEPLLSETQQERLQIQRQSDQQRQERSELLLRVFKDVNRFLGTDDHTTPANFAVFRDTLVKRLSSLHQVRTDFERKVKDTEVSIDQRTSALKKQLEQKWRALDNFEASVKKLELARMQWKSKYTIKEGELDAAKARNTGLQQQLHGAKAGSSTESSTLMRSLTERAESAEKRAKVAQRQLSQLEAELAELQAKSGRAEDKWEARVKEYENRLRIAGEKIKTEKQGGKERAVQLEQQVRELERQVDQARRRNQRAEGVVATASQLLP